MVARNRTPEQRFELFVRRVDEMTALRAFREGTITAKWSLQIGNNKPSTFDVGDVDDLRSALVAFRRFTAPKEDTHFGGIANLVERHVADANCKANIRALREQWKLARRQGQGAVVFAGRPLDAFDVIVNGEVFHDVPEYEALIAELPDFLAHMLRVQMAAFLIEGARILHFARNNLETVLRGEPVPD